MNNNEHVSHGNKPSRLFKRHKNVIRNLVAKNPVSDESDGEVAKGDDNVGDDDTLPHRTLGGLLRRGRDGGLDFEDHIVAGVRKSDVPKGCEEPERLPSRGVALGAVGYVGLYPLAY